MIDFEQIARDAYREVFFEGHTIEAFKPIEVALKHVAEQARRDAAVEACMILVDDFRIGALREHFKLEDRDFAIAGPAPAECPTAS